MHISTNQDLYRKLMELKSFTGDWDELCLFFEFTMNDFGESRIVELCPNGSNILVTGKNVIRYISSIANYRYAAKINNATA